MLASPFSAGLLPPTAGGSYYLSGLLLSTTPPLFLLQRLSRALHLKPLRSQSRVIEMPGADHPCLSSALHTLSLQAGRRGKSSACTQSVLQQGHMCQVTLKVSRRDLSKAKVIEARSLKRNCMSHCLMHFPSLQFETQ